MRTALSILAAGLIALPAMAADKTEVNKIRDAEAVLKASVSAPDRGIPKEMLERADCIAVFPGVKKAAFVVGGEWGRGVVTCRQSDGSMGAPAFFSMGGGSFGWQAGVEEADLVLLIMNPDGVKHLLEDHFTLGGEAAAVAGPVGRTAAAATDAQMHAQILSWSRSRGLFAGLSLAGTVIKPNGKAMERFYGKPVSARDALVERSVPIPKEARSFVETTSECARHS